MSFADQAALALDRAQALADREELAVISDRERIARDLHDVVIQRLFATGLQLQGGRDAGRGPRGGRAARAAVDRPGPDHPGHPRHHLRAPAPRAGSLRTEIRGLVREYAPVLGFTPDVRTSGPVDSAVSDPVREQLLPVLREAVSNVARHALADHVAGRGARRRPRAAADRQRRRRRPGRGPGTRAGCATSAAGPPASAARSSWPRTSRAAPRSCGGCRWAADRRLRDGRDRAAGTGGPVRVAVLPGLAQDGVLPDQLGPGPPAAEAPGVAGVEQGQRRRG